jgi:hypothetical protein
MITKAGSSPERVLGFGTGLDEVVDGALRRPKAIGGLERFGRLDLVGAVRNIGNDAGINLGNVAIRASRRGRRYHNFFDDQAAERVLGSGDMLHAFRDGPAIRSGLEVPLGLGKAPGGVKDIFLGGFEELQGLVLVARRELLGLGIACEGKSEHSANDDSQRSESTPHS